MHFELSSSTFSINLDLFKKDIFMLKKIGIILSISTLISNAAFADDTGKWSVKLYGGISTNQLIKDTHNQLIEKWGPYLEVNDPALYESMTGKKARKPVIEVSDSKEEVKKIYTSYDDLYAYQKKRETEREAQLEREREKLKKNEIKFNFTAPKKDWSIYGGRVNPFESINKGRLDSTQEWRIEKSKKHYY